MKKSIVVLLIVILVAVSLSAEEFTIAYSEGDVFISEGNEWYELFIGDSIDSSSTLKIGSQSMVEIDTNGNTLLLNKPGTYKVGELISRSTKVSAWGNNPVFKKFLSGDNTRSSVQTAVMGVRGAATETEDVEWLSEESMIIDEAVAMIDDGDFEDAISLLSEEMDYAFEEELSSYNYYIGYSYYMLGSAGRALSYLNKVESDYDTDYYPDYVVLKGSLLLDSMAYTDALSIFKEYLRNDDFSATAQAINYLSATALKGLGRDNDAVEKLQLTVKMNPSSDIGRSADQLLKKLQ